jgi:hypothetical protein
MRSPKASRRTGVNRMPRTPARAKRGNGCYPHKYLALEIAGRGPASKRVSRGDDGRSGAVGVAMMS